MCNSYRSRVSFDQLRRAFGGLGWDGGAPNLAPRDAIRITETAPIVLLDEDGGPRLTAMRWSWPGPGGKPVYNFRSEGRRFASGRCLIPSDGFYEYTNPAPDAPKRSKKLRWLFTMIGEDWFCLAGVWRAAAGGGEPAFSMLTTGPGPDVAPYHGRQVIPLGPSQWDRWLRGPNPEALLAPSMPGTLRVERADATEPTSPPAP